MNSIMACVGSEIRCCIFDLDDTLWGTIDTLNCAHVSLQEAMRERCPEVEKQFGDIAAFRDKMIEVRAANPEKSLDFSFLRLETLRNITGSEQLAEELYAIWFKQRNTPVFFPGALDAIKKLRARGLKIGTLTDGNANPKEIDGLCDLVDFCVSAAEVGAQKPDPRVFKACEEKAEYSSPEMLMVGDNVAKDIGGARAAGWRSIWVQPPATPLVGSAYDMDGSAKLDGKDMADATVASVAEIEEILLSWKT